MFQFLFIFCFCSSPTATNYTLTSLQFKDTVFMMHKVTLFQASSPLCPHLFPACLTWCTWICPSTSSPVCLPAFLACLCCQLCSSVTTTSHSCLPTLASCPLSPICLFWGTSWSLFPRVWVSWKRCRRWIFHITSYSNYLMKLGHWRPLLSWHCPTTSCCSYQRAWVRVWEWVNVSIRGHDNN